MLPVVDQTLVVALQGYCWLPDPCRFAPGHFIERPIGAYDLVPQGGGDPRTGHRCPGEKITIALLEALVPRLPDRDYNVPRQDLTISLRRAPARPAGGVVIQAAPAPWHASTEARTVR